MVKWILFVVFMTNNTITPVQVEFVSADAKENCFDTADDINKRYKRIISEKATCYNVGSYENSNKVTERKERMKENIDIFGEVFDKFISGVERLERNLKSNVTKE